MSVDPKIHLVLAFDHELSLGGALDYDRNLFEPTRQLMDAADAVGVPIVLFTDVLCAIAHERWNVRTFVEPYRQSLIEATSRGHDVQLHLHPHWLTSRWEHGTFAPSRDFALGKFRDGTNSETIETIVPHGVAYLRELLSEAFPSYRCVAFRAGGYNLVPESERILRALYEAGVRIDSSVIKGYRFSSDISAIDFSRMPRPANWYIPLEGPIDSSALGGIFEVPIASAPRTPANNLPFLVRRVLRRSRRFASGGRGIHDGATRPLEKLRRLAPLSAWPLSFDNYADDAKDVLAVLRSHVTRHSSERDIVCASVSHPKSMGSHARRVFVEFVERARELYGSRIAFETFPNIHGRLTDAVAP